MRYRFFLLPLLFRLFSWGGGGGWNIFWQSSVLWWIFLGTLFPVFLFVGNTICVLFRPLGILTEAAVYPTLYAATDIDQFKIWRKRIQVVRYSILWSWHIIYNKYPSGWQFNYYISQVHILLTMTNKRVCIKRGVETQKAHTLRSESTTPLSWDINWNESGNPAQIDGCC